MTLARRASGLAARVRADTGLRYAATMPPEVLCSGALLVTNLLRSRAHRICATSPAGKGGSAASGASEIAKAPFPAAGGAVADARTVINTNAVGIAQNIIDTTS